MDSITEAYRAQRSGVAVYGGHEPLNYRLARNYRTLRQRGTKPADALATVLAVVSMNLYPRHGNKAGAPFGSSRLRWIESPEKAGFRFVGFADEIASLHHKGYFTQPGGDTGETLRGAVYQLPARKGRARYVAGYQEQGFGIDGAAALALDEIFTGDKDVAAIADNYGAHREAAHRADHYAEIYAEAERDYQAAWQAGSRWAELGEDIALWRKAALAILSERRTVTLPPAMCEAVTWKVRDLLRFIREARRDRAKLEDDNRWNCDAFNEGAGRPVIA